MNETTSPLSAPRAIVPSSDLLCLSVRQPWPWLMLRPDLRPEERDKLRVEGWLKDVENRDWPTRFRGRVLIHAGQTMTRADYEAAQIFIHAFSDIELPPPEQLLRGGIVGEVNITACVNYWDSYWFCGEYGFVLTDQKPLPFRPLRGQLGFFKVSGHNGRGERPGPQDA